MEPDASARITLKRLRWPIADLLRTYKVTIDGRVVGGIRRGHTESFPVAPGHHRVQLEIDWCSSRELDLDLAPGEEARLVCRGQMPSAYAITRGRSNYIRLERVPPTVSG